VTAPAWSIGRERGSVAMIRIMTWLTLRVGWPLGYALLYPITLYFFLTWPRVRAASQDYLGRVLGRPPTVWTRLRHIFTSASVLMDRLFMLSGRTQAFRIEVKGLDHLNDATAGGRGCLLFGAHFGSFEVLRSFGRQSPVPVRALMHRGTPGHYSRLMEELDPSLRDDIIEIGSPDAMLRVRDSLARGEIVGILADRSDVGRKSVEVPFLGNEARFPTGPAILAAALGVPVVLSFGIRRGPRHYEVRFEPFAERITLDPKDRAANLRHCVAHYAKRLEAQCRENPLNWFNFYPFWDLKLNASPAPARSSDPARGGGVSAGRGRTAFAP
jgi:predicted LPLAT superfamily acyltransferase